MVIVVMGVALGLVMVQLMPDKQAPLREEGARLALLLENAGLEARAGGRSIAWSGENHKYLFFSKNEYGDWEPIDADSAFRPRSMSEGVNIDMISVEEQPVNPGEYVVLNAHSFAVPFRISLRSKFGVVTVSGKSTGDVVFSMNEPQVESPAQ